MKLHIGWARLAAGGKSGRDQKSKWKRVLTINLAIWLLNLLVLSSRCGSNQALEEAGNGFKSFYKLAGDDGYRVGGRFISPTHASGHPPRKTTPPLAGASAPVKAPPQQDPPATDISPSGHHGLSDTQPPAADPHETFGLAGLIHHEGPPLQKFLDIDQHIEHQSKFHSLNLFRSSYRFWHWLKQRWYRLVDKFVVRVFKRKLCRLFRSVKKKSLYDLAEPPNRWEALRVRDMRKEAMDLKAKLVEDFRSHPLISVGGDEWSESSRQVRRLIERFSRLEEPTGWMSSVNGMKTCALANSISSSIRSKLREKVVLGPLDILHLQVIKYLGYFNPHALQLFKDLVLDPGDGYIGRVWRQMVTAEQAFLDIPRATSYPHRYHGFLEHVNLELQEELKRKSLRRALLLAAQNPPPDFGRNEEKALRKILRKLAELEFRTNWPIIDEGAYTSGKVEQLARKCVQFLANHVNFPIPADPVHRHPIKTVYLVLNHVYTHSKADFGTQILIENLIKRNLFVQKSIYGHVLLHEKYTPREFASLTLLENINFLELLSPGMKKHLQHLADREIASTLSGELYKSRESPSGREMSDRDPKELAIFWASYRPLNLPEPRERTEADKRSLEGILREFAEINSSPQWARPDRRPGLINSQGKSLSRLSELVSENPEIWHHMRRQLVRNPVLKFQLFSLLQSHFDSIWREHLAEGNTSSKSLLPNFLYHMRKEISEHAERTRLILEMEELLEEKIRKNLIEQEAVNELRSFLYKVENIWLEVRWSTLKRGAYDVCPIELSKPMLRIIQEYGFGRLDGELHEVLVKLISHLSAYDSTEHLQKIINQSYQDDLDFSAYYFFEKSLSHQLVENSLLDRLDGLSLNLNRKLSEMEKDRSIFDCQPSE